MQYVTNERLVFSSRYRVYSASTRSILTWIYEVCYPKQRRQFTIDLFVRVIRERQH
jgi:hypothetical protein